MNKMRTLVTGLSTLILAVTAACSGQADSPSAGATALDDPDPGLSRVILLGDSVAVGQSLPLSAAFGAAGVEFHSMASEGGGNVVGPNSEERWEEVTDRVESAKPSTFVYQITTYDWGDGEEQRVAYERLLDLVAEVGATLVFVTPPPIVPDEFYEPHMEDLERAVEAAFAVAEGSGGKAVVFDAEAVWGAEFRQEIDGVADRSADGIHTCPQGAARFTQWMLTELSELYPDFTPPDPKEWANTGWSGNDHFKGCQEE
ncbi:SGNH/GDSL hydrolase family protein [Glycomyces sp. NRRL B-16210]|uniref:SGNH/GDSL hydrolase family protein n=1 Tax=Glycomyces sp. NRRL B-16210 TaxID=1463821 RepID=UPI000AADD672|nr:SGNH/GDSL hydrolase family protein [Glycomyces sp. NRRL B-16210]